MPSSLFFLFGILPISLLAAPPGLHSLSREYFQNQQLRDEIERSNVVKGEEDEIHPRDRLFQILTHRWMESLDTPDVPAHSSEITEHLLHLPRRLGDFDELNEIFKDTVLVIPDFYINSKVKIWASKIQCSGLRIDDIAINYKDISKTRFDFSLDIDGLDIQCKLNWRYKWLFFKGDGRAQVYTSNNDASTTISFKSQDFNLHPPKSSSILRCDSNIDIDDMDFQGGIVNSILNTFEKSFRGTLEKQINKAACEELSSLGTTFISQMLVFLETFLEDNIDSDRTALEDAQNAENNLLIPPEVKLIDLFSLESKVGFLVQQAIQAIDETLGTLVSDPSSPKGTGEDLGINKLMRSLLLDEKRSFILGVSDSYPNGGIIFQGHDMLTETIIKLEQVKIIGLDTFTMFDPFNNVGNHTISNHLHWDKLLLEFDLKVNIKPSTKSDSVINPNPNPAEINEEIQVRFGVENIDVDMYLMITMEEHKLGNIELGALMNNTKAFNCFLDAIFVAEITGLSMSVANIIPPTLNGFVSKGIDRIISSAVMAGFEMYEATLIRALPNLFRTTVRDLVNKTVTELISTPEDACSPIPESQLRSGYMNFPDLLLPSDEAIGVGGTGSSPYGSTFSSIIKLIMDEGFAINPLDGTSDANSLLISPLTKMQSGIDGTVLLSGNLFDVDQTLRIDDNFEANIILRGSELKIENIDSVGAPLDLLRPISPHTLNNTVGVGIGQKPLRGSMQLLFELTNDDVQISNRIDITFELIDTSINAAALISLSEVPFMKFPMQYMSNMNCWLSLIPVSFNDINDAQLHEHSSTLSLESLGILPSSTRLTIDCVSCTSPNIELLSDRFSSPENSGDVTRLVSGLFDFVTSQSGGKFLQDNLDNMLSNAPKSCPFHLVQSGLQISSFDIPAYPKESGANIEVLLAAGISIFILLLAFYVMRFVVKKGHRKRYKTWMETLTEHEVRNLHQHQSMVAEREKKLNDSTTSLLTSVSIPFSVRALIPLVIVGNIGLFMSGHLSKGASVEVHGLLAGQSFVLKDFFTFSMSESITDMWESGAKELAVFIIIFSLVWPYTKQLTTLCLWCMPPKWVSVSRREFILLWLDALGKWSFIDIFVLIMSIASFRVSVNNPDLSLFPDKFYAFNMMVVPQRGLYSNMTGQLVSQVSSHFILFYHRKVIATANQDSFGSEDAEKGTIMTTTALRHHFFDKGFSKDTKTLKFYDAISYGLVFVSCAIVVLVIYGCIYPSFSLDVLGLVGVAVESGLNKEEAYSSHHLFSIVQLLSDQASFLDNTSDYVGLGILSAVLIFTVLIVPLVQVMTIIIRWFVPLSKQGKYQNFVISEALQAWQYTEVYILAIIIATWQLGLVSEFMINDYCGGLDDLFTSAIYYGFLSKSNAQCFRVNAEVNTGTWILFASSILLLSLIRFVGKASLHQEQDEASLNSSVPNLRFSNLPFRSSILLLNKDATSHHQMSKQKLERKDGDDGKACTHESMTLEKEVSNQTEEGLDNEEGATNRESLVMPPALFTDEYQWFLTNG